MIRVFFFGRLMNSFGVFDKNRRCIATNLDPKEFQFLSFSNPNEAIDNDVLRRISLEGSVPPSEKKKSLTDRGAEMIGNKSSLRKIIHPIMLARYGNKIRTDILQSQISSEIPDFRKRLMSRNPDMKYMLTLYGMPFSEPYISIGEKLCSDADIVTTVSRTSALEAKERYGVDCEVIYDSVDYDFFRPAEHHNSRPLILYVGTLQKRKNPQYVVKMAKSFPECDFIIHGRGEMHDEISAGISKLDNIKLSDDLLSAAQLRDLYASADVFLFPTMHEGFANVILEAAACGLPILGMNATSMPEFVTQGKEGFLAEDYNDLEAKLRLMADDENLRKKMSADARAKAMTFDMVENARQYGELFRKLVQ